MDTQQPASQESPATLLPASEAHGPRITIWLDSTRMEGATIYERLFPDKASQINFQLVDRTRFPAEILSFNQQGSGWPDVVFAEPELVALTIDSQHDYPLDLKKALSAEMLDKFEPHANDACTYSGQLFCLRHDTRAHGAVF